MHQGHRAQHTLHAVLFQLGVLLVVSWSAARAQVPGAASPSATSSASSSKPYGEEADCQADETNAPRYSKNFFNEIGSKWTDYRIQAQQLYRLDKGLRCLSFRLAEIQTRAIPNAASMNTSQHEKVESEIRSLTNALVNVSQEWKQTVESCQVPPPGKAAGPATACDEK